jgi:hypothetical protein
VSLGVRKGNNALSFSRMEWNNKVEELWGKECIIFRSLLFGKLVGRIMEVDPVVYFS